MKLQEQLLSKNGLATIKMSKALLKYSIGDRVPTISEFSSSLNIVRGTVQNALKNLTDAEAIRIESKGHLGSYLIKKNTNLLLKFAGIDSLVGVMPLPYSKRYEGLATGIISTMEDKYDLPISLAYMRGSKNRISMLLQNRYDFAVLSKLAAREYIERYNNLCIAVGLGEESYLSEHVIMFHDKKDNEIKDGMKIGLDSSSFDQRSLIEHVCKGKNVEYVELEYSTILSRIIDGDIDATVMNVDEALDKDLPINIKHIENINKDNTEAVIVVNNDDGILKDLVKELIDVDTIRNVQRLVLEGKITPSY